MTLYVTRHQYERFLAAGYPAERMTIVRPLPTPRTQRT